MITHSRSLWWLSAAVFSVTHVSAQVSPLFARHTEGNWHGDQTFAGTELPDRLLQVHDDLAGARTITALALRPDYQWNAPANRIGFTLRISNAAPGISAANLHATFDGNHGANRATFPGMDISFPAVPYVAGAPLPRPFAYRIPMPTAFSSIGTTPLVWDVEVWTRPSPQGPMVLDAVSGSAGEHVTTVDIGQGCRLSASAVPLFHWTRPNTFWSSPTLTATLHVNNLEPGGLAFFGLGASGSQWFGATLPILIPSSNGAPSGSCFVHTSREFELAPAVADGSGYATTQFAVPLGAPIGLNFYTQAVSVASAANPLGLVTSNGVHTYVAPPALSQPPVGHLHQTGPIGPPRVNTNAGYVVRAE